MNNKSDQKKIVGLLSWLGLCFFAAFIGAIASIDAKSFYAQLHQPDWAPPGWVFGPVWSILYGMMGIAAWRVWCVGTARAKTALIIFFAQLAVNVLWSWLFFKFHFGTLSFIDILFLWCLILATIVQFWRIQVGAGALLIPYLIWVAFAAKLNLVMWHLNPTMLW